MNLLLFSFRLIFIPLHCIQYIIESCQKVYYTPGHIINYGIVLLNNEYSIEAINISGLIILIYSFHSSLLNLQIEANAPSDSAYLDYEGARYGTLPRLSEISKKNWNRQSHFWHPIYDTILQSHTESMEKILGAL